MVDVDTRPRPDSFYGFGKAAAEGLCSLYHDRHGLDVAYLRIGSFRDRPTTRRLLSTWLSVADGVRLVVACLRAERSGSPSCTGSQPTTGQGGFILSRYTSTMPLSIKDPETDRLARELSKATGETLTNAVAIALRERLERVRGRASGPGLAEELTAIALRCAQLPLIDDRPEEEILGYDEHGLPA